MKESFQWRAIKFDASFEAAILNSACASASKIIETRKVVAVQ